MPQGTRACNEVSNQCFNITRISILKGTQDLLPRVNRNHLQQPRRQFSLMLPHLGALGRHLAANLSQHRPNINQTTPSWSQHRPKQPPRCPNNSIWPPQNLQKPREIAPKTPPSVRISMGSPPPGSPLKGW